MNLQSVPAFRRSLWLAIPTFLSIIFLNGFDWGTPVDPNHISGNGIIEATEVEVSSKISGRIQTLAPREGDTVKVGQDVVLLDGPELEGQVMAAHGNLLAAEARLAELEAGTRPEEIRRTRAQFQAAYYALQQAQAKSVLVHEGPRREQIEQVRANLAQAKAGLTDSKRELLRLENLERDGAAPGQQLDQAKTRRDIAETQVKAAQQKLAEAEAGARSQERVEAEAVEAIARAQLDAASASLDLALAGPRSETIAAARGQLEQARGQLKSAEATFAYTRIQSPCDGRVTLRNCEPGEFVTPGLPIIRLAKLDKVWVRVFVPEPEIGRIKLGQKAQITTDSSTTTYPGRVIEISEKPEFTPKNVQTKSERVKLVFGIKIEIDNQNQDLKPGMPADAVILINSATAPPGGKEG